MARLPRIHVMVIAMLASALCGVLAFLAFVGPDALARSQADLLARDRVILATIQGLFQRPFTFLYGTVTSVDPASQRIGVVLKDPFGGPDRVVQLTIVTPAYIARQDVHATNGIVDGLSRQTISTLADIHPGDRVAFTMRPGENGALVTQFMLFGDPL